jgi:antitoxin component of RelBE/YafQ-DinJ toxin-antitoxin module
MDATLNVRMSAPLKQRGDKVLQDNGITTSAAVRALWQELATTRSLPPFLAEHAEKSRDADKKKGALLALLGAAEGSLTNASDEDLEAIGRERYE